MESSGELEQREKGEDGEVRTWLRQIDLAKDDEKKWREDAKVSLDTYKNDVRRGEGEKRKEIFNILWANVETKRPALYNSTPRPDVRRRYRDKDPLGKTISEILERGIAYTADCSDLNAVMQSAVNDMLLAGRGVTRVKYKPTFETEAAPENAPEDFEPVETVTYEEVEYEQVAWDKFGRGPGQCWEEVPFIWFDHELTKDQVTEKWPDLAEHVEYDVKADNNESDDTVFKRCLIHEVWDKEKREVVFFAPSYKDKILSKEPDPLKLKDFWPIPRPVYAIQNSTTLVPTTEYSMYQILADELDDITWRMKRIIGGLRLRGVYDSTMAELKKVFDSNDNEFIPAENLNRLLEGGGLEKGIWTLPVEMYAGVLEKLYVYRQSLIQQIYEITGISDILRGDTNANETLGAQQLKAQFGSQRLQEQQREVQRYARDLITLTSEIITEKFEDQTISVMTGLSYPTAEEKQQATMAAQQYQAAQTPVPEQLQEILSQPTWDDINTVLRSDVLLEFRVDIETDSTIAADQQADQKAVSEMLGNMAQYFNSIAPAVQSGAVTMEAASKLGVSIIRRFKFGREVEDAFEQMADDPPQQDDGEAQKAQLELQKGQMELQGQQMEQQARQKELQMEQESKQMEFQMQQQKHADEMEISRMNMLEAREAHAMRMAEISAQPTTP